jgi:NitT/TauT family transport system substrate-binding protein
MLARAAVCRSNVSQRAINATVHLFRPTILLRTPQDLIAKTVATQGTARILLRALLAHLTGFRRTMSVTTVMGGDIWYAMTGQVDVATGWNTNVNTLSILGDQRVDMALWDAGTSAL